MNKNDILNVMFIWFASALGWRLMQTYNVIGQLEYWTHVPNRYRLFHQLLIYFHDRPLSIYTLIALSFGICMTITYLIVKPKGEMLSIFLLGVIFVGALGYGFNAIIYPIMAIIGKYRDRSSISLLLIPLVLFKEFAFFVSLVFLVLYSENSKNKIISIIVGIMSTMMYLIIVSVIPGDAENVFTLFYMIQKINLWFIGLVFCMSIMILCIIKDKRDVIMVSVTGVAILFFGLFWEPQLWFPTIVLIIAVKRVEKFKKGVNE